MNEVHLSGNIVRDAKIGEKGSRKWARFTVAVEGSYDREKKERRSEFINCVFFVKAEAAGALDLIKRGAYVEVTRGRIETRKFEGKTGEPVYLTEVVCEELKFPHPKRIKMPKDTPKEFDIGFQDGNTVA